MQNRQSGARQHEQARQNVANHPGALTNPSKMYVVLESEHF